MQETRLRILMLLRYQIRLLVKFSASLIRINRERILFPSPPTLQLVNEGTSSRFKVLSTLSEAEHVILSLTLLL